VYLGHHILYIITNVTITLTSVTVSCYGLRQCACAVHFYALTTLYAAIPVLSVRDGISNAKAASASSDRDHQLRSMYPTCPQCTLVAGLPKRYTPATVHYITLRMLAVLRCLRTMCSSMRTDVMVVCSRGGYTNGGVATARTRISVFPCIFRIGIEVV